MALGLISIHAERAFPPKAEQFTRSRFGMPLFWSGQVQLGLAALTLLGTQIVFWLARPDRGLDHDRLARELADRGARWPRGRSGWG